MICDVDTRLWASPSQLGPALAAALRRRAGERLVAEDANEEAHATATRGVGRTFVHGFRSAHLEADLSNDFVIQAVRRRSAHLVGVAGIDPLRRSWRDDLERALGQGHVAISVSPSYQNFLPTHTDAMALWEACATRRLPVFVSQPGPIPPDAVLAFDAPLHWDEPLRSIEGLTVVFPSLGWPWVDETLVLLAKHSGAFAHIAGVARRPFDAYRHLSTALDLGVAGKLLFASGFPLESSASAIERLYAVNTVVHGTTLPSIPRRELQAIVERDAFALLGIRDPAAVLAQGEQAALLAAARSLLSDR